MIGGDTMSAFVASLPMYNLPEMAAVNTAFWRAIAEELRQEGIADTPDELVMDSPPVPDAIRPATLFTQTCGYPLQTIYQGQYQLLGVPTYDAPGCGDGTHRAFILVRADSPVERLEDLRGGTFALNSRHSNSGMNLPRVMFARIAGGSRFFSRVIETGSHAASMQLVASGGADAASIDCLTYAFFSDYRPEALVGLRRFTDTPESPAIPFVTAADTSADYVVALQRALSRVVMTPQRRPLLSRLRLRHVGVPDPTAYARLLDYEREAFALGYGELA
jgi:ABC-type phosphate/phosphonate transport system substrate-binding protein